MLEVGCYLVVCVAFNHWNTAIPADAYPDFVLAMHSSKKLVLEQVSEIDLQLPILLSRGLHHFPPSAELFVPPDGGRDREPDAGEGDAARGARGHDGLLPHQGVGGARRHDREQAPRQMGSGQSLVRQLEFIH